MKLTRLLLLSLLALLVAACGGQFEPAEAGGEPGDSAPEPTQVPTCQEEDLVAPILVIPADLAINPTYGEEVITQVLYPDASCVPGGFEREVYDNPGFGGNANNIINPSPVNIPADSNGYYGSGQLTLPLQDCTQYFWRARAVDAVDGSGPGPFSETRTFFTDFNDTCDVALATVCESTGLLAPILVQPEDGEVDPIWSDNVLTVVVYPDANCFPDAFERFVTADSNFAGPNMIYNPSSVNLPLDSNGYYGGGQVTGFLQDCTLYYWRARALVGNIAGPFSETRTFFTDFNGTCPTIFDIFIEIPKEMQFPDWPWGWPMQNTNCRTGDTSQHKNVGTLFPTQVYDLLAVNPEETYVKVHITSLELDCWVWLDLIVIGQGIHPPNPVHLLSQLPVEDPPPPPTATPTSAPTKAPPECSDGIDNDGDGAIDRNDPECRDANDDDEANP